MGMNTFQKKILAEVERRQLTSMMNTTKWAKLVHAVAEELPFPPPYQRKDVLKTTPEPEHFDTDVWYHGDWHEGILPYASIEWVRIRPRYVQSKGRLLPHEVVDEEKQFVEILQRYRIPYRHNGDSYWIYGYMSNSR
jgi:hypothetical protein